jgi:hypothetical protein
MPEATATTPTEAPGAPEPSATNTPAVDAAKESAPKADPAKPNQAGEFKSDESKNAVLADLKKVRDENKALKEQFEAQGKAIAAAFGLTEAPKAEDLTETVKTLQAQIAEDRHAALLDRVAAAHGIDDEHKDLLTETDPEKLKAQAAKVGALLTAKKAEAATPEFQPNPGQGQGGTPGAPDDSYPSHWIPKKKQ